MLIIAHARDERFLDQLPFQIEVDPQLIEMDHVLDDPKLVLMVSHDLLRSAPQAAWNGRGSTPAEVTLRCAVVRRLMKWSYRVLEKELQGNVIWRWFCRIEGRAVPDHSTLQEREKLIRVETLPRLNTRVAHVAQAKKITRGEKLRVDSTVIETNIHYPTDSRLLSDSVRVVGRVLQRARVILKPRSPRTKRLFRNSARRARRLAFQISRGSRPKPGQKHLLHKAAKPYRELVKLAQHTVDCAQQVLAQLEAKSTKPAQSLIDNLRHYLPLVKQVITQTVRRVWQGQSVPAADKLVSLFEPHTAIIRRGKSAPHETEFGRKIWYAEVDGGIISEYRLLKGNPPDDQPWQRSLKHHQHVFGTPPKLATGDRGIFSAENEHMATQQGVERVALPQRGAKDAPRQDHEAQAWFKAALRFRAGIEGRISGLKRARGLDRCLNRGESGLLRWLGWGIIANNLAVIATKLARRRRKVATSV